MEPSSHPRASTSVMTRITSRPSISNRVGLRWMFSAGYTFTAAPLLIPTMPQHSLGSSSRACWMIWTRKAREIRTLLPPDGGVHCLQLIDRLRPEAGRHVLVAAVRDDE